MYTIFFVSTFTNYSTIDVINSLISNRLKKTFKLRVGIESKVRRKKFWVKMIGDEMFQIERWCGSEGSCRPDQHFLY